MAYQREPKPPSWNSSTKLKIFHFASRPFASQVQAKSDAPLTPTETEDEVFEQNQFEAFGLQLKEKNGSITPEETQQLSVLQAKMDDFWVQRTARTKGQPNLLEILSKNAADTPATEPGTVIQPKLTKNKFGDKHEQEPSIHGARGSGQPLDESVSGLLTDRESGSTQQPSIKTQPITPMIQRTMEGNLNAYQLKLDGVVNYTSNRSKIGNAYKPLIEAKVTAQNGTQYWLHVHLQNETPIIAMSGWNLQSEDKSQYVDDTETNLGRTIMTDATIKFIEGIIGTDWHKTTKYPSNIRWSQTPEGDTRNFQDRRNASVTEDKRLLEEKGREKKTKREVEKRLVDAEGKLNSSVIVRYKWSEAKKSKGTTTVRLEAMMKKIGNVGLKGILSDSGFSATVQNTSWTLKVTYNNGSDFTAHHTANLEALKREINQNIMEDDSEFQTLQRAVTDAQVDIAAAEQRLQQIEQQIKDNDKTYKWITAVLGM